MTKVKKITVHNVKAIASQELNLNGATAILLGGNNRGKTTLLKALKDRLLKHTSADIIKQGETDGFYHIDFMDSTRIEWELTTKTKAGEKLTLISKDGSKTSVITEIINWFQPGSFDIDKFLNQQPAQQRKTLENLLGVDLTQIDQRYAKAVEERRDANRDVERVEINYKGRNVDPELGTTLLPTEDLQKELLSIDARREKYNMLVTQEEQLLDRRKTLQQELDKINQSLTDIDAELCKPEVQPLDDDDVLVLQMRLQDLKDKNVKISENNLLKSSLSQLTDLRDTAHAKDVAVRDILAEKDRLIREARMPEGFAFSEDGIQYNGFSLDRESQSSSALYIAALKLASLNVGNVRFLHFDASFLDKNSLKEVLDWASGEDLQIMLERPDYNGGEIRYEIIEEGTL